MTARGVEDEVDVAVLGSGLAALCLTRLLQRELGTIRVATVDTAAGPGRKVGESTVEIGAHFLCQRLGLAELLRTTQLPKNGLRFWFDETDHSLGLDEASEDGPMTFSYWQSFQIERDRFEADLLALGRAGGARHLFGARSVAVTSSEDGHVVRFELAGERHELSARWLVDATGPAAKLARGRDWLTREERVTHSGAWARFRGFRSPVETLNAAGDRRRVIGHRLLSTNHLMNEGYWIWWIPLASGLMSVGVVYDEQVVADPPRSADAFVEFLREHRMCREALARAELVDFGTLRRFAYRPERYVGDDRTALIGQAAGFVDPFYSSGTDFIALECEYLCDFIRRDLRADESWRADAPVARDFLHAFYDQTVQFVAGLYPSFASHELSVARYRRDLHVYWNWYVWPYFSRQFLDPGFVRALRPLLAEARERSELFRRLFVHAHERLSARGALRRYNRGEYAFNQLGHRLFPYIRFERQMGSPMDLELSRTLQHEIDTGTFLALLDALFDGDRSAVRKPLFDALHEDALAAVIELERDLGFGDELWERCFELLTERLTARLAAAGVELEGFRLRPADLGRTRALLAAACPDEDARETVRRLWLAEPDLTELGDRPAMRALQPLSDWTFDHTPWPIGELDWRTVYDVARTFPPAVAKHWL